MPEDISCTEGFILEQFRDPENVCEVFNNPNPPSNKRKDQTIKAHKYVCKKDPAVLKVDEDCTDPITYC